jgi:large subunit ribosomal protein L6
VTVGKEEGSKLESDILNSVTAHVRNMVLGAKDGYTKKMQVIYSHFPISLEAKGSVLTVKNFLGEKRNREAKIIGATKVDVKGQNVTITGPNKEDVGQTVSNIKTATKIRRRDSRVFQDGLYTVE